MDKQDSFLVEIKGQKDGLWILLDDQIAIQEVFAELDQKLTVSNNFFSGAEVAIGIGIRVLSEDEEEQLRDLVERKYALHIREIIPTETRVSSLEDFPQSNDAVSEVGVRSENESNEAKDSTSLPEEETEEAEADDEFMRSLDETFRIPIKQTWKQRQTYSSDYLYENEEVTFYFRGTVRSGQTLEFPGNIVILGDVNPGAYVIASGDILVIGRLHGVVHAGAEGEEQAIVIGVNFNPSQLRIAQYIGRPPDDNPRGRTKHSQTEKAYIKDGTIVIEPIL